MSRSNMRLKASSPLASRYASMEPRSSRLLSGRRVPSRHSARFISRSDLAIAIDAPHLFRLFHFPDVRPYRPGVPGSKAEGPAVDGGGPRCLVGPGQRLPTATRSQTKISDSPGAMALPAPRSP